MNKIKYCLQIGSTAFCTNSIMEATKGISHSDVKEDTKDF